MRADFTDVAAGCALVLGAAVWIGGFVTIVVVTKVASRTLPAPQRVPFARELGRTYGVVATLALLLAIAGGFTLMRHRPWDTTLALTVAATVALVGATAVGVVQARGMTRLRHTALDQSDDPRLLDRVRRGARTAALLRTLIGVLTVVLVILGAILATPTST